MDKAYQHLHRSHYGDTSINHLSNGKQGRLHFNFALETKPGKIKKGRRSLDDPFRILLLADLRGRAQSSIENEADLYSRPCLRMDGDEFDTILMKYAPYIDLPIGRINFRELDDFHPDQLYNNLEIFKFLRETREKLKDPNTFPEVAQQLRVEQDIPPSSEPGTAAVEPEMDVFDRLLGKSSKQSQHPRSDPPFNALSAMIREIVAPHILPAADPHLDQYIAAVDMAIAEQMRAILHDREFQNLEATWRGIWDLVTSLELDDNLELFLLDVGRKELFQDLKVHSDNLAASALYHQFIDKADGPPNGRFWSVIVGLYDFGYNEQDIELLTGLGYLAAHAGAAFLGGAAPSLICCNAFSQCLEPSEWASDLSQFNELRKSPVASRIGLTAPRVLMRLPYGKKSDEIESFDFEELSKDPDHENFLWGNSALACAKLLGMAFNRKGWAFKLEDCLNLEDLPAYPIHNEYGSELIPCAEVFMSERVSEEFFRRGIIALMSYRNRNAVRIQHFQSIADPPASLAGPWQ